MQRLLDANRKTLSEHDIKLSIPQDIRNEWLSSFFEYCNNGNTSTIEKIRSELPIQGTWVLSDENFSGTPYDFKLHSGIYPKLQSRVKCFKQIFNDANIEVFFSIRSYDTFYRSTYLEVVRNRGYIPFSDYYQENQYKDNNWVDVLEALANALPEKNITLWCYEDFSTQLPNILKGMTGLSDINKLLSAYKIKITRPSISRKTIEALDELHPKISQTESKKRVEDISSQYPIEGIEDQFLPFGTEKSIIFRLQYKKDISTIIDKYPNINFIKSKHLDKL